MLNYLRKLDRRLNSFSVFRSFIETEMMSTFHWMIASLDSETSGHADPFDVDIVNIYASFVNSIYNEGGNLTDYVKQYVQNDENSYLKARLSGKGVSPALEEALMVELDTLQEFAHLKSENLKSVIDYDGFLPSWDTSEADIKASYIHMLDNLKTRGYGMFASYGSFVPKDGTLVPIVKADPVTLDKLYGYELERHQVLANTQALADGKAAANVLLYGDAGTGKSSTIKACANALFDQGVRLVQFDKYQLYEKAYRNNAKCGKAIGKLLCEVNKHGCELCKRMDKIYDGREALNDDR